MISIFHNPSQFFTLWTVSFSFQGMSKIVFYEGSTSGRNISSLRMLNPQQLCRLLTILKLMQIIHCQMAGWLIVYRKKYEGSNCNPVRFHPRYKWEELLKTMKNLRPTVSVAANRWNGHLLNTSQKC